VVRDAPEEIDELIAKEREQAKKDRHGQTEQDDVTMAEADGPLTSDEMKEAQGGEAAPSDAVADADADAPTVPNFVGKTVKDVVTEAAADGLEVEILGSGLARLQTPQPGAALVPGEPISVSFTTTQHAAESAKGADARRQTREELPEASRGVLDPATVLRESPKRQH
jgi:cell division protein FtsI (penicillin-binding protein 3)